MQELAVLNTWPDTLQPTEFYAGCNEEQAFAYAGRQFNGIVEHQRVLDFYRPAVARNGWQEAPGGNATLLCAARDADGLRAFLSLSIAVTGTYDLQISDEPDPECGRA